MSQITREGFNNFCRRVNTGETLQSAEEIAAEKEHLAELQKDRTYPIIQEGGLTQNIPLLLGNYDQIMANPAFYLADVGASPVPMAIAHCTPSFGQLGYFSLEMALKFWMEPLNQKPCACGSRMYRIRAVGGSPLHDISHSTWFCPYCRNHKKDTLMRFSCILAYFRNICALSHRATPNGCIMSLQGVIATLNG